MSLTGKIAAFAGGVLFGTAGFKLLGSKDARKVYTHVTAAALRCKDQVMRPSRRTAQTFWLMQRRSMNREPEQRKRTLYSSKTAHRYEISDSSRKRRTSAPESNAAVYEYGAGRFAGSLGPGTSRRRSGDST